MRKYVQMGECVPRGYRVAWSDPPRKRAVAYPFGLHILAWLVHEAWWFSYWYPTCRYERLTIEWINQWNREHREMINDTVRQVTIYKTALLLAATRIQRLQAKGRQPAVPVEKIFNGMIEESMRAVDNFGPPDTIRAEQEQAPVTA
jgi:hypothetical protein